METRSLLAVVRLLTDAAALEDPVEAAERLERARRLLRRSSPSDGLRAALEAVAASRREAGLEPIVEEP